jgi:hypothetical protein
VERNSRERKRKGDELRQKCRYRRKKEDTKERRGHAQTRVVVAEGAVDLFDFFE